MNVTAVSAVAEERDSRLGPRDMSALDRCDACGARAWVRAVMTSSELLFCAHHGSKHLDALQAEALYVQDERAALQDA